MDAQFDFFDDSKSSEDWKYIAGHITCVISTNMDVINPTKDRYPIITVELTYTGKKKLLLKWDENFGNLLWDGDFILISEINNHKVDTTSLKFQTSNVYYPETDITLKNKMVLKSTVDFTTLPASYAVNLLNSPEGDTVNLGLYVKVDGKKVLISNQLKLSVKE